MSSTTIENILKTYQTHTPNLHKIIIDTIEKNKQGGRWEDVAYKVITHPDVLENNQYLTEDCRKTLETLYINLRR